MREVDEIFFIIYNINGCVNVCMKTRMTLSGVVFNISGRVVEKKLEHIEAEKGRAKYSVEIEGTELPIKQVLSRTLDLPKATFTTQHAFDILTRLGFKITETS